MSDKLNTSKCAKRLMFTGLALHYSHAAGKQSSQSSTGSPNSKGRSRFTQFPFAQFPFNVTSKFTPLFEFTP
jgi:hypothetical protein